VTGGDRSGSWTRAEAPLAGCFEAEDDASDVEFEAGAEAHDAGLEGGDEGEAGGRGLSGVGGGGEGDHLGVSSAVAGGAALVPPLGDAAALVVVEDASDGGFAAFDGLSGDIEGVVHHVFIGGGGHGRG